jgi:hypothetical protein
MSDTRTLFLGEETEADLVTHLNMINIARQPDRQASLEMLKSVYRRGAQSYSASHRPDVTREDWAWNRVGAFSILLHNGRPSNAAYTSDNDLLPVGHPNARQTSGTLLAAACSQQLTVTLQDESAYATPEDAILTLTEYMGLGYAAEPAVRASWLRAVRKGDQPFARARHLAEHTYLSLDADLLPIRTTQKGL